MYLKILQKTTCISIFDMQRFSVYVYNDSLCWLLKTVSYVFLCEDKL